MDDGFEFGFFVRRQRRKVDHEKRETRTHDVRWWLFFLITAVGAVGTWAANG